MGNLAINEKAPDFCLVNYKGNNFKLSDFKEKSNVLIVLNRGFV
jgi:peroxiredoxin